MTFFRVLPNGLTTLSLHNTDPQPMARGSYINVTLSKTILPITHPRESRRREPHLQRHPYTKVQRSCPPQAGCLLLTVHSATGFTPFELLFGRLSTLPSALKKPPEPQYNYDDYVSELRSRLQTVHHHAHKNLIACKGKSKNTMIRRQER